MYSLSALICPLSRCDFRSIHSQDGGCLKEKFPWNARSRHFLASMCLKLTLSRSSVFERLRAISVASTQVLTSHFHSRTFEERFLPRRRAKRVQKTFPGQV